MPLGHTDTDTTCLHVPSIGLVVAGDAAYNGAHLYLAESNPQPRREWIAAVDTIEALKPRAVISGNKRPENDDNPKIIEETRQYIRDFDRLAGTTTTAQELYAEMLHLYPDQSGCALEFGARSQGLAVTVASLWTARHRRSGEWVQRLHQNQLSSSDKSAFSDSTVITVDPNQFRFRRLVDGPRIAPRGLGC